jgi:hypothetical protein
VDVLWILTVGSVVATAGVVLILVLEAPPWFDRKRVPQLAVAGTQLAVAGEVASEAAGAPVSHV